MYLSSTSSNSRIPISRYDFSFGIFPESRDCCHTSSRMDGPCLLQGFSPWKFFIPHYDEMTSVGPHNRAFLLLEFWTSQFRNASVSRLQDLRNTEPCPLQIFDMCPKWMDNSDQILDFTNCKAKTLAYMSPDDRIPDLDDHMTCVLPEIHGCDPFTISRLKSSQTLVLLISKMLMDSWTPWRVQTDEGSWFSLGISRLAMPRWHNFSVNSKPLSPKYRRVLDYHHVSPQDGWFRLIPGFSLWKFPISHPCDSRFHECRNLDGHASRRAFPPPVHET